MNGEATDSVVIALVQQRLGNIEAKLDKIVDDHEARLRRVEAWMYAVPAAVLISLGSVIAAIVAASR
jgi:type II secretory pathway component PulF